MITISIISRVLQLVSVYVFLLSSSSVRTNPVPQEEAAADAPAEEPPPADAAVPEGETTPEDNAEKQQNDKEQNKEDEQVKDDQQKTDEKALDQAQLTLPDDATTPSNVFTNRYGEPVKEIEIFNVTMKNGEVLQVFTQIWKTYWTLAPTKPGCICLTRAPLSLFKLRGNLHFKHIKVTPSRPVSPSTTEGSTQCPPCITDCSNCG